MKSNSLLPLLLLILFLYQPAVKAELIIDSVNYAIDIGDCSGSPGLPVAVPIMIKNQIALGGFLIRIEYDTNIIVPIPMDACPEDACPGYCCDSTGIDPLMPVIDSLILTGRGLNTITIDSSSLFCDGSSVIRVIKNTLPLHDPGDDSMHTGAMFIRFITPLSPQDECSLNYWDNPYLESETGDASNVAYVMFMIKPDVAPNSTTSLYVRDYRPDQIDDPAPDYRYNQFTDTTGSIIIRPIGAFGSGELQIGEFVAVCGDVDNNGELNILDIIYMIAYKFQYGPPPIANFIADVDNDGDVDIPDIIYLIDYKFMSGPPPECD